MATCRFCNKPINLANPYNWQRVEGWEHKRNQGGTNALALREAKQEWAHALCIDRAKHGFSGQGRLA